jgi:uncharacterized glyoxalase superfamily metalloenzyme YdcJ
MARCSRCGESHSGAVAAVDRRYGRASAASNAKIAARLLLNYKPHETDACWDRCFDDCFENGNGEAVYSLLASRAAGEPALRLAAERHGYVELAKAASVQAAMVAPLFQLMGVIP